jgi:hypothetical protein
MKHAAIAAALGALLSVARLGAESNRSLTDSENRILLAQGVAIAVPDSSAPEEENVEALQEQILLLRSAIKSLTESLAIANSEAETFKRQAADLTLKIEALGIPEAGNDQSKLEQKLLAAVRDLRLLKKQHEAAANQLVRLTEAVQVVLKSTEEIEPQARLAVETELRKSNEILGAPNALQTRGVIDVRKSICGAVIQSLESEKQPVKTGDRLKVDARH